MFLADKVPYLKRRFAFQRVRYQFSQTGIQVFELERGVFSET